jgi:hypothetical protein
MSTAEQADGPDEARPALRPVEAPDSPKARARAMRAKLAADKSLDLIVPGYEGLLGVRYRPLGEDEWTTFARRIEAQAGDAGAVATGLEVAADLMIAACEAVIWRDALEVEWEVVNDDDDQPIRFDVRLAEWLGFEATTAREVVKGVFSPEGVKPISPSVHGDAIAEWQRGNDQAINRALLGK